MKQSVCVFVSLVLMVLFCVPVFGQPSSRSVETISIDNFDTADEKDWTWATQASRFVTGGYPKMSYFDGIPSSMAYLRKEGTEPKVLGVKAVFDRKGDNWFEVYPSVTNDKGETVNYEIPFVGLVSQVDFWVWGANYLYFLEILVRDAEGRVHVLPACDMGFEGWRNVVVNIPTYIRQQSRLRSGPETMSFVGFRVRTDPNEFVDDFVIYFDDLKYTTNVLKNIYDGYELRKLDFGGSASQDLKAGEK
ncbi:MAG: flagellar filament protein FlaA [Spirochaetaceae bacterium]|nr:flagellar filament protein FlaA [Spirochaetaceae bacterium]